MSPSRTIRRSGTNSVITSSSVVGRGLTASVGSVFQRHRTWAELADGIDGVVPLRDICWVDEEGEDLAWRPPDGHPVREVHALRV